MIIENTSAGGLGTETSFEFKYIPQFDTVTSLGEYNQPGGLRKPVGVEKRNLSTLVITSVVMAVLSYVGFKGLLSVVEGLRGLVVG